MTEKLSEEDLNTLADQVSFTERDSNSMRVVFRGRYIGTVVESSVVTPGEDDSQERVIWLYRHDKHTQLSGEVATRREAVQRLLRFQESLEL